MTDSDRIARVSMLERSVDVIGAELQDSIVLLQTRSWTYLELNETGIEIWKQLEKPRSLASLIEALTKEFEVDETRCRGDIESFMADLTRRDFIRIAAPPQEAWPRDAS